MLVRINDSTGSRLFLHKFLLKTAGILFVLTMISVYFVCGLFARYSTLDMSGDLAKIASAGNVSVFEHKAHMLSDGTYSLINSVIVTENTYMIIPGITIPKDPYVSISGDNDVSCNLYIEIVESSQIFSYKMNDEWIKMDSMQGQHDGVIYKYCSKISPHQNLDIHNIFSGNSVRIKDDIKNKLNGNLNSTKISINLYAYLIQSD